MSASVPAPARRGWVLGVLGVYVVAVIAVLLSPVSPESLVSATTAWLHGVGWEAVRQGWVEFSANVVLFFPVGALVTLVFRRAWLGVAAALVLSASAELAQILLPGRMASPRDVLANVLGAALGAAAALVVRALVRRARRRADTPRR